MNFLENNFCVCVRGDRKTRWSLRLNLHLLEFGTVALSIGLYVESSVEDADRPPLDSGCSALACI